MTVPTFAHSPYRMLNGEGVLTELADIRDLLLDQRQQERAMDYYRYTNDYSRSVYRENCVGLAAAIQRAYVHIMPASVMGAIDDALLAARAPEGATWDRKLFPHRTIYLTGEEWLSRLSDGAELLGTQVEHTEAGVFRTDYIVRDGTLLADLWRIGDLDGLIANPRSMLLGYLKSLEAGLLRLVRAKTPPREAARLKRRGWSRVPRVYFAALGSTARSNANSM